MYQPWQPTITAHSFKWKKTENKSYMFLKLQNSENEVIIQWQQNRFPVSHDVGAN